MSSPPRALGAALLLSLFFTAAPAIGAALAVADQSGGYAGTVLDKTIEVWAPPPALKGDFEVRLKVAVDGKGKVLDCKPVKASGMEALDSSACGAVRQAAPFGTPPYGMPIEVHLAFWTGVPRGKAPAETLSSEEALRAEILARDKAERLMGQQRASSVEDRARERAEAIAKSAGKDLPEVAPAPVAPAAQGKGASARTATRKGAATGPRAGLSQDGQATEVIKASKEKSAPPAPAARETSKEKTKPAPAPPPAPAVAPPPAPAVAPTPAPAVAASGTGLTEEEKRLEIPSPSATAPRPKDDPAEVAKAREQEKAAARQAGAAAEARPAADTSPAKAQDQYDQRFRKYLSGVVWNLRNAMFVPEEAAPGTYYATVRLNVDATGAIQKFTLLQSSGDTLVDRFVLQGIRRAGSIEPTPAGLGNTLDLTFTLVRR